MALYGGRGGYSRDVLEKHDSLMRDEPLRDIEARLDEMEKRIRQLEKLDEKGGER